MNRTVALIATCAIAVAALAVVPAQAAGTLAGTEINNTASVAYQVNSINQTGTTSSATLTVDRVINMTLVHDGPTTTVVNPGQKNVAFKFTASNQSNATIDIWIPAQVVLTGGTTASGGVDSFNLIFKEYYADSGANGVLDTSVDSVLDFASLDEVEPDGVRTFFYVFDIPTGLADGVMAGMHASAQAREGGVTGERGVAIEATSGANTSGVDTVLADPITGGDPAISGAGDGKVGVSFDIEVSAATLSVVRSHEIIFNLVEGTSDPKVIPGALVEYCVQVSNAAGAATADNVTITETMGATLTYDDTFGIYQNGSVANGACNADGTVGGTHNAGVITGTISSIAAGETKTIRYRAKVN